MGRRGVVGVLAAATSLVWTAAPPPAQAGYVIAGAFTGTVAYSSPLTALVTSRTATLNSTNCVHQGVPTLNKGPVAIPLLPPCSLTLTFPMNVAGVACLPVGATTVAGSFTGMGGTWAVTNGLLVPSAVFGGVTLVVQGQATQTFFPGQTAAFTLVAAITPPPWRTPDDCLTNAIQSFAIGEFQLDAPS